LLARALRVLRQALADHLEIAPVALALCRAQPTMAPLWNAGLEAVAAAGSLEAFDRVIQRATRATTALSRFGVACLEDAGSRSLSLVTISSSGTVLALLDALSRSRRLQVACAEGRPALEGRRLAAELASRDIAVSVYSDAAIGHALATSDVVLVGADAVTTTSFLNKSGTRMLVAAAAQQGRSVYVVATRDKFLHPTASPRLSIREGEPGKIWETAPAGVSVRNPYFEETPLDSVTGIISDIGVLAPGMIPDACAAAPAWPAGLPNP
jgi:translation initiation factor 2B subunit (eIF-2B alpha/beta/delta family)